MASSLADRLRALIQSSGPIPLSVYMEMCLHDSKDGYYVTRPSIGQDFTTAPEISQIFGECIGVWAALTWQNLGYPKDVKLVECGPGRGVLMADILRTLEHIAPELKDTLEVVLVETSEALRQVQTDKIGRCQHVTRIDDIDDMPTIMFGNEFLDCLPVKKYAKVNDGWVELRVGMSEEKGFILTPFPLPKIEIDFPPDTPALEVQPALAGLVENLAARASPFRTLWIDYGPYSPYGSNGARVADSFRAYSKGLVKDPLTHPGRYDVTVDVDFTYLEALAQQHGLQTQCRTQAEFLLAHGIQHRFEALTENKTIEEKAHIYNAVKRLTHPDEMGEKFKAFEISNR